MLMLCMDLMALDHSLEHKGKHSLDGVSPHLVVAVDGPAAAGKTTTCKALSRRFGLGYLESGRTYRIIAFEALRRGLPPDNPVNVVDLCDELLRESREQDLLTSGRYGSADLRSPSVNVAVSDVARIHELRKRVTELVRLWARHQGRCIVEGRDIGTVVFPAAPVKFYLTASPEERARRRLGQEGGASYEEVLADVVRRDEADMSRAVSPLVPADDAIVIDTTTMDLEEVLARMGAACERRSVTFS
ncbi:cytidylate kinase/GTP-binding protein [Lentzea jiangxiensis]|uniref:Cytidylate kinase n=2 Tax=Lentzea jiangxiensis TaxID=641025 RepID=A0A1H0NTD6_9PSEU|nr:cytidylate kinase/GTP-binding protein [Lentzea jiangxiensis]